MSSQPYAKDGTLSTYFSQKPNPIFCPMPLLTSFVYFKFRFYIKKLNSKLRQKTAFLVSKKKLTNSTDMFILRKTTSLFPQDISVYE